MSWLTVEAAAKRVGRGESTIRRWIGQGLPVVAGRVSEDKLLDFERAKRESRGRPRKVEPGALVLAEVAAERARQDAKWGQQNHDDGTGPDSMPLYAATATGIADDDEAHLIRDMLRGRTDWRFSGDADADRPGT
ncbi:hypothetical protein ACEPTV_33255, partial [Burkholderia pseudomallei]|uniref:hypothetical protein n=1 Tax=Burkholderia pseudomallei TaxID=28450 RepID=UPI0035900FE7